MAQSNTPRRPAMLDAARAEAIVGDEDPASLSAVAHTAAWALMGIGDETFSDEAVARLRETVRARGVDTIAHVWSRSPEFTLPGALWRVYLLHEWYHRDPILVAERYAEGSRAPIIQGLEAPVPRYARPRRRRGRGPVDRRPHRSAGPPRHHAPLRAAGHRRRARRRRA